MSGIAFLIALNLTVFDLSCAQLLMRHMAPLAVRSIITPGHGMWHKNHKSVCAMILTITTEA